MKINLPDLRQFDRYWTNENKTDFVDKKRIPVVYALFIDEVVAYIGISTNFWERLKQHKLLPRTALFTSFAFYEFEHATIEDLRIYEILYIKHYEPLWNRNSSKRIENIGYSATFS